jgi:hypothetical protein
MWTRSTFGALLSVGIALVWLEAAPQVRVQAAGAQPATQEASRELLDRYCPGGDQPLAPSRGQVMDHLGLAYPDLDPVIAHLEAAGIASIEGPCPFGNTRAILIEDLYGLALELIEEG